MAPQLQFTANLNTQLQPFNFPLGGKGMFDRGEPLPTPPPHVPIFVQIISKVIGIWTTVDKLEYLALTIAGQLGENSSDEL